ncbi:pantoate--beta-alanine ligase [Gorillibacterium timonense]|uniref:pantoate--beta-alanine ligase n=1 Tax=Gorillibacterium timonense TaxID=1689269 RepID=UPI00071C338F|nr:pantoate--beta-alanine ligase [Gorillibacterium timonense]
MQVFTKISELRKAIEEKREQGCSIGLVPTMGFLHEGHASLISRARRENDCVVLSIFVNPTQFGPNEDLDRYPRNPEGDLRIAETNGADFVFMPEANEMYPRPAATRISVSGITSLLCGASRPGHFDGVGLIVSKLFHIVKPHRAYFGMKDAQQVAVVSRMVEDLNLDVEIVPCPIVRGEDGLALSSRNVYLSPEQRSQALVLSETLRKAPEWLAEVGGDTERLKARISTRIREMPLADIEYVEILTYPDLEAPSAEVESSWIIALAVRFGSTRLIDNRLLTRDDLAKVIHSIPMQVAKGE